MRTTRSGSVSAGNDSRRQSSRAGAATSLGLGAGPVSGTSTFPGPGDPSISQQSSNLGDPIAPGSTRHYQVYYRDPDLGFCPQPAGNSWNVSNGVSLAW